MVTDKNAYIGEYIVAIVSTSFFLLRIKRINIVICILGTSNWSADYFVNTGGIGFVMNVESAPENVKLYQSLLNVFERDWNSSYTQDI